MHLKNFSVIQKKNIVTLSPAYDLLNTTIVLSQPEEELALPLNGKTNNFRQRDLVEYFGYERLGLPEKIIDRVLREFRQVHASWSELLDISFLSAEMKKKYHQVLDSRFSRLFP